MFLSRLERCLSEVHKIINLAKIANYQPKLISTFLDEEIKSSLLDGSWLGGDSHSAVTALVMISSRRDWRSSR